MFANLPGSHLTANSPLVIVVTGATASGKSALAVELALKLGTAVVSADSRQVYREMLIGTARIKPEESKGVPHYLSGHVSIHDEYNAGLFAVEAREQLDRILSERPIALVCGGTGLYLKALLEGFDQLPAKDEALREELKKAYETKGISWLQAHLEELDPEFYRQAELQNPQRLIRAIEIVQLSGKTHAELKQGTSSDFPYRVLKVMPDLPRAELYARIDQRVQAMMAEGWETEARTLYPFRTLNALQTVGYKELFDYIEGKYSREDAIRLIQQHTRNYAKRQLTWFRRDTELHRLQGSSTTAQVAEVEELIRLKS